MGAHPNPLRLRDFGSLGWVRSEDTTVQGQDSVLPWSQEVRSDPGFPWLVGPKEQQGLAEIL